MNRRDEDLVSRIYVGNLPSQIDHRDVEREFERFGKVVKCDLKKTVSGAPFAFIEFEDPRDARDAIKERDGYDFDGSKLRVEIPFNARSGDRNDRGDRGRGRGAPRGGRRDPPRKGRYVVQISGLPLSGSWQDIKDHMRDAGECGHADVFHDGTGEISFFSRQDAESAISRFNGSLFRSHEGDKSYITVQEKDFSSGRENDRQGMRYRSPSYERRRDYYNDNRRDSPYNRNCEKYNRRYSSSRSNSKSNSRSNSLNYNSSQRNNYNHRRRYNTNRSRSRASTNSRSRSYNRK